MVGVAKAYLLIYSLLLLVGGIVGYSKAKSKVSLFAGIGSAVVALSALGLTLSRPSMGLGLGILLGLVLTVVFILRFRKTKAFMPAGLLSILSGLAAVVCGLALIQAGGAVSSLALLLN